VRIGVFDGTDTASYTVSTALYGSLGLRRGAVIDSDALDSIIGEDERYRAFKRALNILAYADNTVSNLIMKLRRAGYSRDVAEECAEECLRLGYIDETEQIRRAVLTEANRMLRGREYIVRKLSAKGYKGSTVRDVIDALVADGEIDFALNFERLAEKMGAVTDEERRVLSFKRGYRGKDLD
jgi:SOS response regulatory protein OraA/RecX